MFLVVILFLNLLIAIIVDSYTAVSGEAEASFWTQRMLFIHDMHLIRHVNNFIAKTTLWKRLKCCRPSPPLEESSREQKSDDDPYSRNWELLLDSFAKKRTEDEKDMFNFKCWIFAVHRCINIITILLWVILGCVSAGLLWPPQIREKLFQALVEKENGINGVAKEESAEVELLSAEILNGNQTISTTIGMVHRDIGQLKLDFSKMKQEAQLFKSDLEEIKTMLVDLQLLFRSTNS